MVTLTWTSMNIDSYKAHVHHGLKRLEQLVTGINDVIEHRIENNLKVVRSRRPVTFRPPYAIDATRIHQTRP